MVSSSSLVEDRFSEQKSEIDRGCCRCFDNACVDRCVAPTHEVLYLRPFIDLLQITSISATRSGSAKRSAQMSGAENRTFGNPRDNSLSVALDATNRSFLAFPKLCSI